MYRLWIAKTTQQIVSAWFRKWEFLIAIYWVKVFSGPRTTCESCPEKAEFHMAEEVLSVLNISLCVQPQDC